MRPLDPRLMRYARSARGYVLLTTAFGVVTAALVVCQALLLAHALGAAVQDGATLDGLRPTIGWLVVVVAARVLVTSGQERFAHRAATATIAELREQVVDHAVALGPRWLASGEGPGVVTLATRGLDNLQPYFVRYLPQLLLAATVTPAVLLVVLGLDWVSAAILISVLPLVPIFMILVGKLTQGRSERGLVAMQTLGAQVLDLLAGLPTLRAHGRERGQAARVRALGDAHREASMGTLRIAFLSGMVLELLTTLSVALVAVAIGLRLVAGDLGLTTGIAVLVLAPEVFLPLRQVGAQFHAAADGVAAAAQAFAVLETPVPARGTQAAPDLRTATITLASVSVRTAAGHTPDALELELRPGTVLALTGPSGAGKTTAVEVLLGLVRPDEGTVTIGGVPLADLDPTTLWSQVTWLPQRPVLEPGTIASIVGGVHAQAAALTGLDAVLATLPDGWETELGRGGEGLSLGQRQRVALTRALVSDAPLVILDEPTAHLDAAGEAVVLETVRALRAAGRTVLLVAHRRSLVACADVAVEVRTSTECRSRRDGDRRRAVERRATRGTLRRAVTLLDVDRRRVLLALLLGTLALGCAVALAGTAAWLIARASQMPPVLELGVATVAVRAFGIGRGVLRYLERLVSHDVALRGMTQLRTTLYERLATGRPEVLLRLRRGDLLARVGTDVDAVGDVVVRGLLPIGVAALLGVLTSVAMCLFWPPAGLALAACLVLAGVVAPALASRGARISEERAVQGHSDMTASALGLLDDAGPLLVSGRVPREMTALRDADARIASATDAGAPSAALAAGLGQLAVGLAVLAALVTGIPAVTSGQLAAVDLAVIVLTPLAAFEATTLLPAAMVQVHRSRAAAARVLALLDDEADGPVPLEGDPRRPRPALVATGVSTGWPDGPPVVRDLDLALSPGRSVAIVGPSGTGKTTTLLTLAGLLPPQSGTLLARRPRPRRVRTRGRRGDRRGGDRGRARVRHQRAGEPARRTRRRDARGGRRGARTACRSARGWRGCPTGSTPPSAPTPARSPVVSGGVSWWPARCSRRLRWSCSTSRPSTSTRQRPTPWSPTCCATPGASSW